MRRDLMTNQKVMGFFRMLLVAWRVEATFLGRGLGWCSCSTSISSGWGVRASRLYIESLAWEIMVGGWSRRLAASPTRSVTCWAVARAIMARSGEPESGGVDYRM